MNFYKTPEWRILRQLTLERDANTCRYCGGVAIQADHVIPRSKGYPSPSVISWLHAYGATSLRHKEPSQAS